MAKERIEYIDNAKGILIILMVVGHVFLDDALVPLVDWIYVFHMPAFFIINGICFHYSKNLSKPFWKGSLHLVYTILIPLAFSEAVGALCYIVRFGFTQSIAGFIYNTLHYHFNNGPDWFLVVLFAADLMFVGLNKLIACKKIQIILAGLISLAACVMSRDVFILRSIWLGFGCICLGYYACKLFTDYDKMYAAIFSFGATVLVLWLNGTVSMNIANIHNPLLWAIGAASGTYFVVFLGKRIHSSTLLYIGKNSLVVMITHQAIMLPIRHYTGIAEFNVLQGTIVLIITIMLQFPLIYLINRFVPFLVGKRIPPKNCPHSCV